MQGFQESFLALVEMFWGASLSKGGLILESSVVEAWTPLSHQTSSFELASFTYPTLTPTNTKGLIKECLGGVCRKMGLREHHRCPSLGAGEQSYVY